VEAQVKWKKRQAEIARLRKKYPVRAGEFPQSSFVPSSAPSLTSTGISSICFTRRSPISPPSHLIVGTPHKQGPMVMSRDELPWAGGKKS
jgi:hypothetical protein